jgi:hypothetical protein
VQIFAGTVAQFLKIFGFCLKVKGHKLTTSENYQAHGSITDLQIARYGAAARGQGSCRY